MAYEKLIFELSKSGRRSYNLPADLLPDMKVTDYINPDMLREDDLDFPEVSELDIVRHYTLLSKKNYSVDSGFYPLGSCTMKYNPKINEEVAKESKFSRLHPLQPESTVQGALEVMYQVQEYINEISGMDATSLQPAAGAHGELTGLMLIKKYHMMRNDEKRTKIIVPDSAHGTNPASVSVVGFDVVEVPSNQDGSVDIEALKGVLGDDIAGLMLTNPSTLGLFETQVKEIADLVHDSGGLLYYDGANMNAIMGIVRPGDMGFDVLHYNLHKTFSTPHGGGGPGSGPVACKKNLMEYLPIPRVAKEGQQFFLDSNHPDSIGKIKNYYGNFGVILRAYVYMLTMGRDGLKAASVNAVLNANYMKESLKNHYKVAVNQTCMHEVVFQGLLNPAEGISTLDVAKRIIDYGYHPPTMYFPLIVEGALMIEPTETESKETLDDYIEALKKIAEEAMVNPKLLKDAPHETPVRRVDEVLAARQLILKWEKGNGKS